MVDPSRDTMQAQRGETLPCSCPLGVAGLVVVAMSQVAMVCGLAHGGKKRR